VEGLAVLVRGELIEAVLPCDDPRVAALPPARRIELPACTLLPGLIDAHGPPKQHQPCRALVKLVGQPVRIPRIMLQLPM
jgi:hypothetical protein